MKSHWFKTLPVTRQFTIIALALIILFGISLLLPFYDFYFLNDDESTRTEIHYGWQQDESLFLFLFLALQLMAVFTFRKIFIRIVSCLVILLIILGILYINKAFAFWQGSPIHPNFRFGFLLAVASIVTLAASSFSYSARLAQNTQAKGLYYTLIGLIILLPLFTVAYFRPTFTYEELQPVMTAEGYNEKNGIRYHDEWWDWKEKNVSYYKYFSVNATANDSKYVLDSIHMNFFTGNGENRKKVRGETRKSVNGRLDIYDFFREE